MKILLSWLADSAGGFRRVWAGILILQACSSVLPAAIPSLDHLYPAFVQSGTTQRVSIIGSAEPWPPKVWVDSPEIQARPDTNSGILQIAIGSGAKPGAHALRLVNAEGASAVRVLVVAPERQTAEIEPNDDFRKAQPVSQLPASLNGRLDKSGDVDSYRVSLLANQTLVASLEAFVLASPVDAVLRITDERGVQLALNHDDGKTFDPFVWWTAKTTGTYIVQVFGFAYPANAEVRYAGGNSSIYHLQLFSGPFVRHTLPLGLTCGATNRFIPVGWNLPPPLAEGFDLTGPECPASSPEKEVSVPGVQNRVTLPTGMGPEELERPAGRSPAEAQLLNIPGAITGQIAQPGEVDQFLLDARKGEAFRLAVQSASLGFPLDAWLRIDDPAGKELVRSDDGVNADPRLEWTAPDVGKYRVVVGNLMHKGGEEYRYRLSVERALPAVEITVPASSWVLKAGDTNEIAVSVKRLNGHSRKLTLRAEGLAAGVNAPDVNVPDGGGEVKLKLSASKEAAATSQEFQIVARSEEGAERHVAKFSIVATGSDNGVPNGFNKLLLPSVDRLWLTVVAAKP